MTVSDFQINARVRATLARQWIDLQRIRFGSFRGTVRLSGELYRIGGDLQPLEAHRLEALEQRLNTIPGVRRVHFDLKNWRKTASGEWQSLDRPSGGVVRSLHEERGAAFSMQSEPEEKKTPSDSREGK